MRFYSLVISFLMSFSLLAMDSEEFKLVLQYSIKKDTINKKVHNDSCLITGKVRDGVGTLLKGATVNTVGMKYKSATNKKGEFKLMIAKQQVAIFFFKPGYNEIVTREIDFRGGYQVDIEFSAMSDKFQLIMDKPVLYLYSDKTIQSSIEIIPNGEFTFTYPKYNSSWNVEISPDKHLLVDSKEYPYLFWEAKTENLDFESNNGTVKGEVVKKENVVHFLEEKLDEAGLNPREKTDFITYWAPKMMQYDNYLIQFLEEEMYDNNIAEINVFPKPDEMKRLFMLYQQAPEGLPTEKQKLNKIKRNGFVLIEWGGAEVPFKSVAMTLNNN